MRELAGSFGSILRRAPNRLKLREPGLQASVLRPHAQPDAALVGFCGLRQPGPGQALPRAGQEVAEHVEVALVLLGDS